MVEEKTITRENSSHFFSRVEFGLEDVGNALYPHPNCRVLVSRCTRNGKARGEHTRSRSSNVKSAFIAHDNLKSQSGGSSTESTDFDFSKGKTFSPVGDRNSHWKTSQRRRDETALLRAWRLGYPTLQRNQFRYVRFIDTDFDLVSPISAIFGQIPRSGAFHR